MLFVDDNQNLKDANEKYTYYTDKLSTEFEGQDNESGIKKIQLLHTNRQRSNCQLDLNNKHRS